MQIYSHPSCLKHNPPPDPGYAPKRLQRVLAALKDPKFSGLVWVEDFAPARKEDLCLLHTPGYVDDVLKPIGPGETRLFGNDTVAVEGTAEAALYSTGAALAATKDVIGGKALKAFCAVSPGGHHAEAEAALGFCFFNHVALAAVAAQKIWGIERIAVIDFDAHHGNGTQSFFWNFEDRLFISLHEDNPLSGFAHETGAWKNVLNRPLLRRSDGTTLRQSFLDKVVPKIDYFEPDMLFVSAGFDMHADDPLGLLRLHEDDFRWLGEQIRLLADRHCKGRLVAVLEGGYNIDVLGACVARFIEGIEGL